MNEQSEKTFSEVVNLCGWCGVPLGSANLVRQAVCVRCYELLRGANLSNEEIFGDDWREKKNHPSVAVDMIKE